MRGNGDGLLFEGEEQHPRAEADHGVSGAELSFSLGKEEESVALQMHLLSNDCLIRFQHETGYLNGVGWRQRTEFAYISFIHSYILPWRAV